MKIKKLIKKEVSELEDVLCDSCGNSCLDKSGYFEFMDMKVNWGYGSKKDMEQWTAQVCEKCVDEKLTFINFSKKELHLNSRIGTNEDEDENLLKGEDFSKKNGDETSRI